jgi:hypothetical protein
MKRLGLTLLLFIVFCAILLPAGDGGVPVGAVLLMAAFSKPWWLPASGSWVSFLMLFFGDINGSRMNMFALSLLGVLGLMASWIGFLLKTEDRTFFLAWSLPFMACLFAKLVASLLRYRRA